MGMMTPSHKQAVAAYERELRRMAMKRRAQMWGYTAVCITGLLLFFDWLSK